MTTIAGSTPQHRPATSVGRLGLAPAPWARQLWAIWIVLMAIGAIGVFQRITQGHLPAGYGSYVPWGLWIAIYFHGVGIAGGVFAVGALGFVLNIRGLNQPSMLRTVIVLSLAAIVPAFMAVWFDLGHMERASRIILAPSFTSMMAFNAWMYLVFVAVATIAWVLSFRHGSEWLKPVLCLGLLLAIVIPSQSGAFFGVVHAKPYWHSALFPVLFLASALTCGAAMLLAVRAALGRSAFAWAIPDAQDEHDAAIDLLRRAVIAGLVVYTVLEFAEYSVNLWGPLAHAPEIELVLWGPYWWVFWLVHLGGGIVLPLAVFFGTRRRSWWALAALLVAVTMLATRLNVLIPGQAVNEIRGLQDAFSHARLDFAYHATAMEYMVGFFLVGVGMAAYYVLRRIGAVIAIRMHEKDGVRS